MLGNAVKMVILSGDKRATIIHILNRILKGGNSYTTTLSSQTTLPL